MDVIPHESVDVVRGLMDLAFERGVNTAIANGEAQWQGFPEMCTREQYVKWREHMICQEVTR